MGDGEVDWTGEEDTGVDWFCCIIAFVEEILVLLILVRDCVGEAAPSGDGGIATSSIIVSSIR